MVSDLDKTTVGRQSGIDYVYRVSETQRGTDLTDFTPSYQEGTDEAMVIRL